MKYNRNQWIAIIVALILCIFLGYSLGHSADLEINADCCTVHIDSADLVDFNRSIAPSLLSAYLFPKPIAERVDHIFKEVQGILGLLGKFPKVSIYVYPTKEAMHEMFVMLEDSGQLLNYDKGFRAAYLKNTNAIYMTTEDVFREMLAHEMGHAIFDNSFLLSPPVKLSEIVAQYVGGKF